MKKAIGTGLTSFFSILIFSGGILFSPGFAVAQTGPGPEVCANCHKEKVETYLSHKHSMKTDARTPAAKGGCAVCHGDGTAHVKAGGGKGVGGMKNPGSKAMSSDERNGLCLTCHQGGQRMHWSISPHANRDTTCTSCHTIHATTDPVRNKPTQAQVCFTCHKEQRAQINRPYRHPIEEGKVVCSDCHNPHGSAAIAKMMKRDSVVETCYQCHLDKRGPFVRSHQPATEDCSICHNPHGTTYPNLLKLRTPFLCQTCHEMASHRQHPAFIGGGSRNANFEARGCLNCHTNIHGSNFPNESSGRGYRR